MTEVLAPLGRVLVEPFADPASRTFWPGLLVAGVVAALWARVYGVRWVAALGWRPEASGSLQVDAQLLVVRQLLRLLGAVPVLGGGWWLATRLVLGLDALVGRPSWSPDGAVVAVVYSVVLFVAWDASRYVLHRLMHEIPALWEVHQVHHSAEALSPLTFHRLHPLESVLYGLRGLLVTGLVAGGAFWLVRDEAVQVSLLGVHAGGLVLNTVFGNLRHSHVAWSFGRAERWFLSPAQHQVHHGRAIAEQMSNYGTWLALWDRWGGTWRSGETVPEAYGVDDANHAADDLVGALVQPIVGAARALRPRRALVAAGVGVGLAVAGLARAQEADEEAEAEAPDDDDLDAGAIIEVEATRKLPRVAGSAYVVGEEELEAFEYDDIHKVVARVPGVYVRDEDGFGLRPNLGLRGGNSDRSARVTLMEDGVLFGPAPYAAPAAYYFPMSTRMVGVEVFKGPAAIRFGPNTIGGAINLRTRDVPTDGPTAFMDLAGGLYSTIKAHAFGGWGNERGGVLAEALHLSTGGFKELDDGGPTGFDRQEFMLKGRIASPAGLRVQHELVLKAGYGRERSNETYTGLTLADFEENPYRRYVATSLDLMRWQRSQAEAHWTARIGDVADVRTVAYHHHLKRAWFKLNRFAGGPALHDVLVNPDSGQNAVYAAILRGEEDSLSADQILRIGTNDRSFHSFGVQSVARWRASSGIVSSQLEVGARVHADLVDRVHTEDPYRMEDGALVATGDPRITTLDAVTDAVAIALHAQEDLLVGPVRLLPGFRMEAIRTSRNDEGEDPVPATWTVVPLPGFSILGSPTPWLDLFAGVHRGFSPVAPGQADGVAPESAWNVEAGGRFELANTYGEAVGFFSDYDNILGTCTFSGGCSDAQIDQGFNGGAAYVAGLEAVLGHRQPFRGAMSLEGELTYTYTFSEFRTAFVSGFPQFGTVEVGDALPYVPEHQGGARLRFAHPRFSLSAAVAARTGMRDEAGQDPLADAAAVIGPMATLDLAAEGVVSRNVRLYATVRNATAHAYLASWRPFGARPGPPISFLLGIKVGLGGAAVDIASPPS